MRPLRLSMTAFGPFVSKEVVNFDALGAAPLFLINGATGSGKTTILDAICFALYGQTTGKDRQAAEMRCDYADENTLTEVELLFELGGSRYRISRIPEQQRAKAKGEGTTRQAAKAELWRLQGDTEQLLVPAKVSEATQHIESLTGLQVDQFRQVMVLPQGQFRRLLMADSKDREGIFSQLFETQIYKQLEDRLRTRAKEIEARISELSAKQAGVLQTVDYDNLAQLEQALSEANQSWQIEQTAYKACEARYIASEKRQQEAQLLARSFLNFEQLQAELADLQAQSPAMETQRQSLQNAELAQQVSPLYAEFGRAETALEQASKKRQFAFDQLLEQQQTLQTASEIHNNSRELAVELDQLKSDLSALKAYRPRALKLASALQALEDIKRQEATSEAALLKVDKQLQQHLAQLQSESSQQQQLETNLQGAAQRLLEQQELKSQIAAKQSAEALQQQLEDKQRQLDDLTVLGKQLADKLQDQKKAAKQVELAWHRGQAQLLAQQLEPDQACPVCGSETHPAPAKSKQVIPTEAQRQAAQQDVDKCMAQYQLARDRFTELDSQIASMKAAIDELGESLGPAATISLAGLQQQATELAKAIQQDQGWQTKLDKLKLSIGQLSSEQTVIQSELDAARQQHQGLHAQLLAHQAEVDHAQLELPEAYRMAGQLDAEVKRQTASITAMSQQIEEAGLQHSQALQAEAEARANLARRDELLAERETEHAQAVTRWQQALSDHDFDSDEAYQAACLDAAERKRLKAALSEFDQALQSAAGGVDAQKAQLADRSRPDLALLSEDLQAALNQKQQADTRLKQIEARLNSLRQAQQSLLRFAEQQAAVERDYAVLGTLSNVANGVGGHKISLQRFVLGVLLDEVLIAASYRLDRMSKGQFQLIRKVDRSKGNRASGLDLQVEDRYSGKVRAVTTLSGGEEFMASLSLALGLSDVVQSRSGGIRLDTLFIDEGFGSLDSEALDRAIRTLIDLADSGRMVGIISHVSELKEQIPQRLDVISGRNGSKVLLKQ